MVAWHSVPTSKGFDEAIDHPSSCCFLSVVLHDVTCSSFQCCHFWKTCLPSKDQQLTRLFPDSLPSWSFPTPCLPRGTQHLASSANKHPSMARCHWLDRGSRWTNLLPLYQWGELSTHHFSGGKHGTCGSFGHLGGWFSASFCWFVFSCWVEGSRLLNLLSALLSGPTESTYAYST